MSRIKRWKAEAALLPEDEQAAFWLQCHYQAQRTAFRWAMVSCTAAFATVLIVVKW